MKALLQPVDANDPRFAACGTLLTPQEDPSRFGAQDAELAFAPDDHPRFYVMRLRRRPPQVSAMTCHRRVSQCLGSADAQPFWMVVAPPGEAIDEQGLLLVKLQPGEGVKLHPGTWHAGPYFSNSTGLFFNLELRMTNENDHNATSLEQPRVLALT